MRFAFVTALGLGLAAASGSWAQAPTPAPAAPEGVDYLAGRWLGAAADPGSGQATPFDYKVERLPGGAWLGGAGVSADGTINARDIWGRDPLTGEIMRLVFDSSGAFGVVRSPGWDKDRLVLEGEVRSKGGTLRVRETITRLGPNSFRAVWEAQRNGQWAPYSVETLTRRS